jgi:hypothetical protein
MIRTCSLYLQPLSWVQSLEHYTGINVEGRRFGANCNVQRGSGLRLSNRMRLVDLSVHILIFETTRMQDELTKLPKEALGSLHFQDARPADDIPAMDPFLHGWFVLNARSFEDAWDQVRECGYTECTIMLDVGPVDFRMPEWLWDVAKTPHLVISNVTVSFQRPAPTPGELKEPEKKNSSFWRRWS